MDRGDSNMCFYYMCINHTYCLYCNDSLNLKNELVIGRMKDDGFYPEDGDELSYNWNVIRWRKLK